MFKQRRAQVSLAVGAGVFALMAGMAVPFAMTNRWPQLLGGGGVEMRIDPAELSNETTHTAFAALNSQPDEQRLQRLESLAKGSPSLARHRARYLLAIEQLRQNQGQAALSWLQDLERDYPLLAAHVLMRRAQAYELMGDQGQATATWQALLNQHPQNPVAAEALFALGRNQPQLWDEAIARFPAHPRSLQIARTRLQKNPRQLPLLRLLARHGLDLPGYTATLDQLVSQYSSQLRPEDWEAIAFGYWENQEYGKAGSAYARAPYTALNAYRTGRGLQLGGKPGATRAYQRAAQDFPKARETGLALMRLSRLSDSVNALTYLDRVIAHFPDRAAEALGRKAEILDATGSRKSAAQVRKTILTRYASSDAAAQIRWQNAQAQAKAGNAKAARQWAEPILKQNPESELAPEAGFWIGKWAQAMNQRQQAKAAFENVLRQFPQSYYAWRSASQLGWEVGSFTTVRDLTPTVARPAVRDALPAGSPTLQELYQLGQDQDAWTLWQTEFQNRMQPTVAEQFTDGVMRQGVGDNLDGIFMVSFLSERDIPAERQQYYELKQKPAYWQALYPFPFLEPIEAWSQKRQLNPLLVTALIRQESRFETGILSSVGATGLMQVMPETGEWIAKQIKLKQYDLKDPEDNIKLGTWYLDYTHREYNNNSMLAVASYNAGPGAVGGWVQKRGLGDPDQFVENIPYNETRGYVKSVFENYWNYLRLYNPEISRKMAEYTPKHPQGK